MSDRQCNFGGFETYGVTHFHFHCRGKELLTCQSIRSLMTDMTRSEQTAVSSTRVTFFLFLTTLLCVFPDVFNEPIRKSDLRLCICYQ
jgi:hypothetical protein